MQCGYLQSFGREPFLGHVTFSPFQSTRYNQYEQLLQLLDQQERYPDGDLRAQ